MTAQERARLDAKRYGVNFAGNNPTRVVTPMLPNSYDASRRDANGMPRATPEQIAEDSKKMYSLVPAERATAAPNRGPLSILNQYQTPGTTASVSYGTNPSPSVLAGRYPSQKQGNGGAVGANGLVQSDTSGRIGDQIMGVGAFAEDNGLVRSDPGGTIGDQVMAGRGARMPSSNAQQRWQQGDKNADGTPTLSPQRRSYWATGRIDASAAPDSRRPAPVRFVNSRSNWTAY